MCLPFTYTATLLSNLLGRYLRHSFQLNKYLSMYFLNKKIIRYKLICLLVIYKKKSSDSKVGQVGYKL